VIVVVGLSHKTAPIAVRERLAVGRDELPRLLDQLVATDAVNEAVVLSTCNRVEVFAAPTIGRSLDATRSFVVSKLVALGGDIARQHLQAKDGNDAVRHLFRVASSLDSLVIGEPQILGQLKDAIIAARDAKALGQTLGKAMLRAIRVGKRVRNETAIGAGQVSVSSVSVDLAQEIFGDLRGRKAALVGAGEMAEAAARLLAKAGAKIVVLNRSPARANQLAEDVGGEPRTMADLERTLIEVDIAITSTSSPTHVITTDLVKRARKARRGRSLFLIDIAVPRDIDPAVNELDGVYLYDVDDLSRIVAESLEGRAVEAVRAEAIVAEEAAAFEQWTREREFTPTIAKMFARTRGVLASELERSLSGRLKHLGPAEKEALVVMIGAATNKLLHGPVSRLRELAGDARADVYVEAVQELWDLANVDASAGDTAAVEQPPLLDGTDDGMDDEMDDELRAHDSNGSRASVRDAMEEMKDHLA
jgi:glutamyl-tRNA reductase